MTGAPVPSRSIWTAGHSNRSLAELIRLLREAAIGAVADVRRFPSSRRHPHFDRAALAEGLAGAGIAYAHHAALGGHRAGREGSPNTAFEEPAFNAYADHVATSEFAEALVRLENAAASRPTAVLCAEADPLRCHRRILADVLDVRGWQVIHLERPGVRTRHRRTPFARVTDGGVSYPGGRLF